jgi:hypothetical protein
MSKLTLYHLISKMELVADMKRAATDCDRDYYEHGDDSIGAILQALREIYPNATAEELLMALEAAEAELTEEVARLGGWDRMGETPEIEAWLELAKIRTFDLGEARLNVE